MVSASGNGVVTSKPLPAPGPAAQRNARAAQRAAGNEDAGRRERDRERGHARRRGTLEFLPNLPVQHHRMLDGKNMRDRVRPAEPHRVVPRRAMCSTQTDPTADEIKRKRPGLRHQQPADGGALRAEDQPHDHHGADRRVRVRGGRPSSDAPPRPRSIRETESDPAGKLGAHVGRDGIDRGATTSAWIS